MRDLLIALAVGAILGFLATYFTPAKAGELSEFTPTQKALYVGMQGATVADWGQTLDIARDCRSTVTIPNSDPNRPDIVKSNARFKEANSLLGSCPSVGRVNHFMIGRLLAQHYIVVNLPEQYRTPVMSALNIVYFSVVNHNRSLGVKVNFGF